MPRRHLRPKATSTAEKPSLREVVRNICTRNFNIVTAVNLLVMTVYYLIFVIGTGYVQATYGASLSTAGFTSGIMVIGCLAGRFVSGNLMSVTGARLLLLGGLSLYALSLALFFLVGSLPLLFADRLLTGLAVGITGTATATIAAYVIPAQNKAFGISLFSLSTILALALGPFLGIVLMQHIKHTTIMLVMLIVAAGALAVGLLLKNPPKVAHRIHPIFELNSYIDPRVVRFAVVPLIVFLGYGCIQAFMAMYAAERGLQAAASVFFLIYAVAALISRPITGSTMDSNGENIVIYPLFVLTAIGLLLLANADSSAMLLLAGVFVGLGYGNFQSIGQAVSLSMVTPSRFAQATSTFFIFMDFGIGLGPYIFGFLVPHMGFEGMFYALTITLAAAMVLYHFLHGRRVRYV